MRKTAFSGFKAPGGSRKEGILFKCFSNILIFLSFLALPSFCHAAAELSAEANEVKCSSAAYVIDADPNGLNVRSAPEGEIISRIPCGAMVAILAEKDGWIKIGHVEYYENEEFAKKNNHHYDRENDRVILENLNGWVFARMLGTSVRNYSPESEWLLSENRSDSKKTVELEGGGAGVILVGCNGGWLKVKYQGKTGWLKPELNCPNPFTTCP